MPIFEYKCAKCKEKFEELVTDQTQVMCPNCGSVEVNKLFSAFGYKSGSSFKSSKSGSSCGSCSGGSCSTCH